jgi:translation initiation factor 1A
MAEENIIRVRMPRKGEVLGVVTATLGSGRFEVRCDDGFLRICRIPGKMRRRVRIRPGYIVLIQPWSVQTNERGDVIWVYNKNQSDWLKEKGIVKKSLYEDKII